MNLIGLFKKE